MKFNYIFHVSILLVSLTEGYRILCLFPFNGKSHFIMFDALCKGLAKRGHQVDMISHFPTKILLPNYTDIVDLSGTKKNVVNSFSIKYAKSIDKHRVYTIATTFGYDICELMGLERMQKFIKNPPNDPPYDLVITEYFGSSCYLGFGELLKVPIAVALSSLDMPHVQEFIGSPMNNAFFPGLHIEDVQLNSFWDRLRNTWTNFIESELFYYYSSPQTEIMRKYLGQDLPDIRELERRVSLVITNGHYTFHGIRPTVPALVEVGGLHVAEDNAKLTPELQSWLDSAKHGLVYFTLGSLLNIETMPEKTILDIYASFKKIAPVKVLMKCADKTKLPPGIPPNILTLPWIPQVPVLKHKNTRLFITHGGLMGSQEALHHGVPLIGIPVFADQLRNINVFVHKGMAVRLDIEHVTESSFDAALNATLNDPSYRENARKHSEIFLDRPMKPMDTAIFWIEYVVRHGANSLRSVSADMPWWQLHLLDVYAFLIACVMTTILLIVAFVKKLLWIVQGVESPVSNERKKR